jgi:repressor LexA
MQNLTPRQLKAFEFIKSHTERVGYAPTLRELCDFMGYKAVGSAQDVIASLRKKGFITTPMKQAARSLTLSDKGKAFYGVKLAAPGDMGDSFLVPCLGKVPAGVPIEAIEDHSGYIRVSSSLLPRSVTQENLFALQAKGLSMLYAGILDGDWLVIQQTQDAPHGTIVVAQVDENATVKRLCLDPRRGWYLKPENPDFQEIYADEEPFTVLGRVVALQRTMFDMN